MSKHSQQPTSSHRRQEASAHMEQTATAYAPRTRTNSRSSQLSAYTRTNYQRPARTHKRHIVPFVILGVLLALIILLGVYAGTLLSSAKGLMSQAQSVEPTAQTLVSALKSGDTATIQSSSAELTQTVHAIANETDGTVWKMAELIPVYGGDVKGVRQLIGLADSLVDSVLTPVCNVFVQYPLSSIVAGGSINGDAVTALCNTLVEAEPDIQNAANVVNAMGTFHFDQLNNLLNLLQSPLGLVTNMFGDYGDALKALPTLLGCNGQRTYLVVALNNSEVRASTGLPGAFVTVTIDNGNISFGETSSLSSITKVAESPAYITDEENEIYGDSLSTTPANMTYTPDFSRAATLLAQAWSYCQGVDVDGVVALDPTMFQYLLAAVNGSFTLSDGTYVDGSNASEVLISDIYWNYTDTDIQDALFGEAAMLGVSAIQDNISSIDLSTLFDVIKKGIKERRLMAWMANADEEALLVQFGCGATLNTDSTKPMLGVYFNDATWSKISWYLDYNTTINGSTKNADGSTSYQVTTVISNLFGSEEEAENAPEYVTGYNPSKLATSDILGSIYLYAPAGGYISDISIQDTGSTGMGLSDQGLNAATHDGLQVLYGGFHLLAGESCTITYTVTTATDAAEELELSLTPPARA